MAAKNRGAFKSKLKDSDLDAEFEKFLNESLSDESGASPRRSVTPKGTKSKELLTSKQKFDKPWWATSEDDDMSSSVAVAQRKSWLKKRKSEEDIAEPDVVDVDIDNPAKKDASLVISKDSLDGNGSRPGTVLDTILSESEYSYSENLSKKNTDDGQLTPPPPGAAFTTEVKQEYNNDSFVDSSNEYSQKNDEKEYGSFDETDVISDFHGKDTLEEIKDKDTFFSNIEKNNDDIDYKKLTRDLEENDQENIRFSKAISDFEQEHDEGFEIEGLELYQPPHHDDLSTSEEERSSIEDVSSQQELNEQQQHSYSEIENSNEESDNSTTPAQTSSRKVDDVPTLKEDKIVSKETIKEGIAATSLLSKVNLMESLDSTGGLHLAEKLEKLNQVSCDNDLKNIQSSMINENTSQEGYKSKSRETTADLAEALHNIKQLSTQSFGQSNDPVDVISDLNDHRQLVQSGKLILDNKDYGKLPVNNFDLQPVVSNFSEEPKILPHTPAEMSITNTSYMTTHPDFNQMQTFTDINDMIASEIVKQYMNERSDHHKPYNAVNQINTPRTNRELQTINNTSESFGFSLQPISALVNESDDSPPTDSLKSIKSIAEERKRDLTKKSRTMQTSLKNNSNRNNITKKTVKRNAKETPKKRTSIPSFRKESLTKTHLKPSEEKYFTSKKTENINRKPPRQVSPQKCSPMKLKSRVNLNSDDLMTSIELLSSSLRDFQNSTMNEKDGSGIATKISLSKEKDSHLSALHREQSLQGELRALRILYEEAVNSNEKLQKQNKILQNDLNQSKERLTHDFERCVKDLNEQLYVLKKKLEVTEKERDEASDLKGKEISDLSKEDIEKLQKQVNEQEALLNGYQQENERLYQNIKKREAEKKKIESKMFEENQKLASEVGNLSEQLELRPKSFSIDDSLGASKITQLNNQIKFYKAREGEYKLQILQLENEISSLRTKINIHERSKNAGVSWKDSNKKIDDLKSEYSFELDKLNKKLKWYSENQELLDRDLADLKDKREEIKELRILVNHLEIENKNMRKEKFTKNAEKNSDHTKIKDLQRQVKEMEDILKRRHPNSIPALIYAASAVPGETKVYDSTEINRSKPVDAFLEKRIKLLEEELDAKDEESSRKVRAIEQRYTAMTIRYEDRIKQFEAQLTEYSLKLKSDKNIIEIEDELSRQRAEYEAIINNLKLKLNEKQLTSIKINSNEERNTVKLLDPRKETSRLKTKLKNRDIEIADLTTTVNLLRRERETLLSDLSSKDMNIPHEIVTNDRNYSDQGTSLLVSKDVLDKYSESDDENRRLRKILEDLRVELKGKELQHEAREVEMLNENRKLHEGLTEQLKSVEESHQMKFEKLRMQFAIEHSNSKVAEINGKLKSNELIIQHLKAQIVEAKVDKEKLEHAKIVEGTLRQQISTLQAELHEAHKYFTPEMHHYKTLEAKITSMESRHVTREKELQNLLETATTKAAQNASYTEDKWRAILRNKDLELQSFREELDGIIEVLEELKRQGISLPSFTMNLPV